MSLEIDKNVIHKEELDMMVEIDRISREHNLLYYLGYGTVLGAIRHQGFIPWDYDIDILVDIDSYRTFCHIISKEIDPKYEVKYHETDSTYDSLKARVTIKGTLHHLMHIDIFPMVGAPKSKFQRKIFSVVSYLNYRCYFVKKLVPKINYKQDSRKRIIASLAKLVLLPIPSRVFVLIFNKLSTMFSVGLSDTLYNICGSYGMKEFVLKKWFNKPVYMEFEGQELPVPQEWDKYLTHIYGDYMTPKKENYV